MKYICAISKINDITLNNLSYDFKIDYEEVNDYLTNFLESKKIDTSKFNIMKQKMNEYIHKSLFLKKQVLVENELTTLIDDNIS